MYNGNIRKRTKNNDCIRYETVLDALFLERKNI